MKVKLEELIKVRTGKLDANAANENGQYPFFTCSKEPLSINTYSYDCECVLVAGNGDLNVKYYNGKFDAYQRTYILESNSNKLYMPYLYFFMDKYVDTLRKQSIGGVIKYIKLENITNVSIELPEIDNQKYICNKIYKVKELINKHKKIISYLDTFIKARFVEMFGDLNNTKYDIKTIEECAIFVKDGTHNTPMYTEDKVNGFKFLSSKDVTSGKIDWSNIKYIPKELHNELYERIKPQKNDILLAKNGTTGICAIVDNDEIFDIYVSLALIRLKEDLNPTYIWTIINSYMVKEQFNKSLKGIGVPNLHLSEIKKVNLIVPPIGLQNSFAAFVKEVDKLKFDVQKSLEKTQMLFDSLMQEYFG